ncbi:hypothetical protein [Pseudidiomarina salilacus]|uniref:hypothetical protein n=1 Tax=Pseudidiomarina salilacus TaxID=3384452 RepID=UPI0039847FA3
MWVCSQTPWRWLQRSQIWAVDADQRRLIRLDDNSATELSRPQVILVLPWVIVVQFAGVKSDRTRQPPQWWLYWRWWTDTRSFVRCRRLFLRWRQDGRLRLR